MNRAHPHHNHVRKFVAAAALAAAIAAPLAGLAGAAATDTSAPGWSDYPNYPALAVPAGCSGASFTGNTYTQTHAGITTHLTSLRQILRLDPGDVITWTFTSSGTCTQASLALKDAPGPTFDPSVDQRLLYPYGTLPIAGGQGGTVTYTVVEDTCFAQLDSVAGPPLAVIGPHGSYYTAQTRIQNGKPGGVTTLVDAWNGAIDGCNNTPPTTTPPSTTSSTTSPPVPPSTSSPTTSPTPSTSTTATPAPTTSTPPSTSSTPPSTTTSAPPPASSTTGPPPSSPTSTLSSLPAPTSTVPEPTTPTTATDVADTDSSTAARPAPAHFATTGARAIDALIAFVIGAFIIGALFLAGGALNKKDAQ